MGNSNNKGQRLVIGLAATGSLLLAGSASALEFGSISLGSHLNQPLSAQIVLSSLSDAERASLSVRIASPDMFERFGIARSSDVDNLDVSTRAGNAGQMIVQISTRNAVREPFVDFLLEASTSTGSALREYTVLLNPASAGAPAGQRAPQPSALRRSQPPASSGYAGSSSMPGRSAQSSGASQYGPVTDGETLYSIALAQRPPGTSVAQMELALYQANPRAFAGGMNSLLRGSTLDVPSTDTVREISKTEARQQLAQSNAAVASATDQNIDGSDTEPSDAAPGTGVTRASGELPPANLADAAASTPSTSTATVDNDGLTARGNGMAGNSEFGQLSLPRTGAWATTGNTAGSPAGAASTDEHTGVPGTGSNANPVADTADNALTGATPSPTGSTDQSGQPSLTDQAGQAGEPDALGTTSASATTGPTVPAEESTGPAPSAFDNTDSSDIQDVTAGGEDGLLSPRNLLLGLLLVGVIGGGLLLRRRRQYKPVPLNFDDTTEDDTDAPSPAPSAVVAATGQATRVPPVLDEPSTDQPDATTAEPISPEHALSEAAARVSVGEYASARRCIEDGLSHHPHDAGLQDKLLDMDYQFGDAVRFQQDYTRFEPDFRADSVRHARIIGKGHALLPDDPRFDTAAAGAVVAGAAAVPSDEPFVPASLRRQEDKPSSHDGQDIDALNNADDDAQLDRASSLEDFNFEESDDVAPTERQHDQGYDEGLSFELDDTPIDESVAPAEPGLEPDAAKPATYGDELSLDMINPADFSLDDSSGDDNSPGLDGDTVEIRLDLARMYMEMEDNAMARPLLEEVKANGDDTQKRTAQSLLDLI